MKMSAMAAVKVTRKNLIHAGRWVDTSQYNRPYRTRSYVGKAGLPGQVELSCWETGHKNNLEGLSTSPCAPCSRDLPVVGDDALEGDPVDVAVEEEAGDAADRGEVPVEHGHRHGRHQL